MTRKLSWEPARIRTGNSFQKKSRKLLQNFCPKVLRKETFILSLRYQPTTKRDMEKKFYVVIDLVTGDDFNSFTHVNVAPTPEKAEEIMRTAMERLMKTDKGYTDLIKEILELPVSLTKIDAEGKSTSTGMETGQPTLLKLESKTECQWFAPDYSGFCVNSQIFEFDSQTIGLCLPTKEPAKDDFIELAKAGFGFREFFEQDDAWGCEVFKWFPDDTEKGTWLLRGTLPQVSISQLEEMEEMDIEDLLDTYDIV